MENMKTGRLTCIKMAGKELTKGFINAKKAIKEAFNKPDRWQDSFVSRLVCHEKYPEIDWFKDTNWDDFDERDNFDTRPISLWDNFKMDSYEPQKNHSAAGVYSKTYTTFSGCDIVAIINGRVMGELQGYKYDLDGKLEGNIDLAYVQFDHDNILPDDTLIVATYMNEYGQAAYQVCHLDKLKAYKSGMSIDMIQFSNYVRYHGKLLQPLTPVPDELRNMSNEDFCAMVERVKKNCTHKKWADVKKSWNCMANRVYFWVLEKHFCEKTEA